MKKILLLVLLVGLTSCASNKGAKLPKESGVSIVKGLEGHRWDNIYFSSQPDSEEFRRLKEAGFVTIINLRLDREGEYKESWESDQVQKLGLHYYHVPFSMEKQLTDKYVDEVTEKVKKHRQEGKILVHCSSGNRVGIWLGAHFYKDHGFSKEHSEALAKELGITKPGAEEKLEGYLDKRN